MPTFDSAHHDGILVIGAGELGESMLKALSRRKADGVGAVTVLLRPTNSPRRVRLLEDLAAQGVEVVEADVGTASVAELSAILRRFHTIVGCIGFAAGPGTQKKLAEAVLDAKVPRYVPWQFGVDYDAIGRGSPQNLFDEQLDVRDLLRGQNTTEWVIVSTGMFTSFLFEAAFGVVDLANRTVNALGSWDTEVTVTTADDIGVLTAEILDARPHIANHVVYIAGDTISYRELADIVERVGAAPVIRNEWTVPRLLEDLEHHPDDPLRKYRAVFAQGVGVAWPKSLAFNMIRDIPTTGAEEWARANFSDGAPTT